MNKENGLSFIGVFFAIVFIIFVVIIGQSVLRKKINNVKTNDIKSNMLLIKGACKGINDEAIVNKNTENYVGTLLTTPDITNDQIISNFLSKNIISAEEYGSYYFLSNDDLKKLNLDIENEENSYYLINYSSGEVIITAGINGKYKLSEIE